MRRCALYFSFIGTTIFLLVALLVYGQVAVSSEGISALAGKRQLTHLLGLTDLALFSEARYTRHPSQADLFSPFQDFPAAFEHFPTGSIIPPNPLGFSSRIRIHHKSEQQN